MNTHSCTCTHACTCTHTHAYHMCTSTPTCACTHKHRYIPHIHEGRGRKKGREKERKDQGGKESVCWCRLATAGRQRCDQVTVKLGFFRQLGHIYFGFLFLSPLCFLPTLSSNLERRAHELKRFMTSFLLHCILSALSRNHRWLERGPWRCETDVCCSSRRPETSSQHPQ